MTAKKRIHQGQDDSLPEAIGRMNDGYLFWSTQSNIVIEPSKKTLNANTFKLHG